VVEHLFRTEYGKVLAIITKYFGASNLQLAEDIVQDTLIAAMTDWGTNGIPGNPTAWLVQVAKRKALNEIKRSKMMQEHHQTGLLTDSSAIEIDDIFLDNEIEDSQLRMIFTCCHPDLNLESQISLTLKTLCGFGSRDLVGKTQGRSLELRVLHIHGA
jgi:RNA polymerase sigma factor (sigma-70 family)